jgi:hypothetical protein
MNYRPKRPSELLAAITEQYEEKEVGPFGREIRGGRGKKKGKAFFYVSFWISNGWMKTLLIWVCQGASDVVRV